MKAPPIVSDPEFVPVPLRVAEVDCVPDGVSLVPCAEARELPIVNAITRLNVLIILLNFPCLFLTPSRQTIGRALLRRGPSGQSFR
ncbi:hypothetical protein XF30_32450 [Bradyrhizobium sp. SUTN9-2]|nr:hypothetical protein XF30_32450 [Bradyrhizobium sp. SUTN9-2]